MDEITKGIFGLLDDWREFPNYQLERRLDIFFAYFLPEILSRKGISIERDNIIPEFPLLVGFKGTIKTQNDLKGKAKTEFVDELLKSEYVKKKAAKSDSYVLNSTLLDLKPGDLRDINELKNVSFDVEKPHTSEKVDYAVIGKKNVYFIELKTSNMSIERKQVDRLLKLQNENWRDLIFDIFFIRHSHYNSTKPDKIDSYNKYSKLLKKISSINDEHSFSVKKIEQNFLNMEQNGHIDEWYEHPDLKSNKDMFSLVKWRWLANHKTYSDLVIPKLSLKSVYILPTTEGTIFYNNKTNKIHDDFKENIILITFNDVLEGIAEKYPEKGCIVEKCDSGCGNKTCFCKILKNIKDVNPLNKSQESYNA